MGEKLNYREFANSFNPENEKELMQKITELVNSPKYDDRQKFVALGIVIDKNKEGYILKLKSIIHDREKQIKELKRKYEPAPKKKLVITRRK